MSNTCSVTSKLAVNLVLGLTLAGGLIGSAFLVTKSMDRKAQGTILIKGYAEQPVMADHATWELIVQGRDSKLSAAYLTLEKNLKETLKFLKDAGIKDIKISPPLTFEYEKRDLTLLNNGDIVAYKAAQYVTIASKDIEMLQKLSLRISELTTRGIDVQSLRPQYLINTTALDQTKKTLLKNASKDAMDRAKLLAETTGSNLGRIVSARQGIFQVTAPDSTEVSDYGIYDTSSPEKIMKIVVTLSYAVND